LKFEYILKLEERYVTKKYYSQFFASIDNNFYENFYEITFCESRRFVCIPMQANA